MITRIFGSQNIPGLLFFDDAHQAENDLQQYDSPERSGKGKYKSLQVSLSTQVRLNRPTRTAVPGALYTSEFGTNDLVFKGAIQGWLGCTAIDSIAQHGITPTYSLLLLLAGLHIVERIGGNKSTGKGRCECAITRMEMNGVEVQRNTRESWLERLDVLTDYDEEG